MHSGASYVILFEFILFEFIHFIVFWESWHKQSSVNTGQMVYNNGFLLYFFSLSLSLFFTAFMQQHTHNRQLNKKS